MSSITHPSGIAVSLAVFLSFSVDVDAAERQANDRRPPNIVMIISDDQGYRDFGFMGGGEVRTPNLDRLASKSARYPKTYVPSSVCRPSLATLLTGLYPHQHGIHFNHPPDKSQRQRAEYLIRSVQTLPRVLSAAGYRTLQTGKFWEGHYRNAGFTDGMTLGKPADIEPRLKLRSGHGNGDAGLAIGRETMQPIVRFIDENRAQPFFIWYAPYLPHTPHNAPEEYPQPYLGDPDVPRHRVQYYGACSWFDDTVGSLIDHIEAQGLAEDTLFVFVVDNGWQPALNGKVDRRTKRSPFDLGLRTPVLLRWDGKIKPATHESLVSTVDLVPTMLAAAGLTNKMPGLPGESLLPSARGQVKLRNGPVYGEIYPGDATSLGYPSRHIAYRWVREGDWKLIVPHPDAKGRVYRNYVPRTALFNLAEDPREESDLAGMEEYASRVREMRRLLAAWWIPGDDRHVKKPPK